MKKQAYNKDKDQDSRTQRQSNLHKSKKARFKDLASGEIWSNGSEEDATWEDLADLTKRFPAFVLDP
ncbi:hypothetical protein Tco_0026791 [Tanacetum coccineum]